MIPKEKVKCRNCGELILRKEAVQYDGEYLCRTCCEDDFYICEDCGAVIPVIEAVVVNRTLSNERIVCHDCAGNYVLCSSCGDYYFPDDIWAHDSEISVCYRCSSRFRICEDCGMIISEDRAIHSDANDCDYCEDCYDEYDTQYIDEYSYKPYPEFLGKSEEGLYLGVELEVDRGKNVYAATKAISDNFRNVYLKHDGSLSNTGFEIVSHPATLDYHTFNLGWKEIMDICIENGYKSHDCNTCGLHIHLSREFLGKDENEQDLNIAKLIILFDRFWENYIVPFSRRKYELIQRWADKPSLDCGDYDTENEIVDKVKSYKAAGRYKAINLMNQDTIEFRLFRGTLNLNTFLASLQFVVVITGFVKTIKLNDIFTVSWSDVFDCVEFPELNEYLVTKNLIKGDR